MLQVREVLERSKLSWVDVVYDQVLKPGEQEGDQLGDAGAPL